MEAGFAATGLRSVIPFGIEVCTRQDGVPSRRESMHLGDCQVTKESVASS